MFSALAVKYVNWLCLTLVSWLPDDGVDVSPSGHVVEGQGAGLIEEVVSRTGGGDDVTLDDHVVDGRSDGDPRTRGSVVSCDRGQKVRVVMIFAGHT